MSNKTTRPSGWDIAAGKLTRPSMEAVPPPTAPAKKDAVAAAATPCPECKKEVPALEPPAKFCPSCGAELAAGEGAKPPPDSPAAMRGLGRYALALTGQAEPDAARGTLDAWKDSHTTSRTAAAADRSKIETMEREKLLTDAIASGALEPSLAWSWTAGADADGKPTKIRAFSAWAGPPNAATGQGQSMAQLTAYIEARQGSAPARLAGRPMTPAPATGAENLTESDAAHAKKTGRDPAKYAAIQAAISNKQAVEVL